MHEPDTTAILDPQTRRAQLVAHLAGLTRRGGHVEEQFRFQAIVSMPTGSRTRRVLPNILMAAVGGALYAWLAEPLLLLGTGAALLGWHRKLTSGARRVQMLVRVDDLGVISSRELSAG